MDSILMHAYMEISAALCLFFIAWLNIRYEASGKYSYIISTGTSIAGMSDIIHALSVLSFPDLIPHWAPISWVGSRMILISTFVIIYLCRNNVCSKSTVLGTLSLPFIFTSVLGVMHQSEAISLTWAFYTIDIANVSIYRPADFVLMIAWIGIAIGLRNRSYILFPPNTYWAFMLLGVIVHALLAFGSQESMDMVSMVAHGLKIAEYYIFILIYLLYKNQLDSIPTINTIRPLLKCRNTDHAINGTTTQFKQ